MKPVKQKRQTVDAKIIICEPLSHALIMSRKSITNQTLAELNASRISHKPCGV
jgi:hypothetical protein